MFNTRPNQIMRIIAIGFGILNTEVLGKALISKNPLSKLHLHVFFHITKAKEQLSEQLKDVKIS